MTRLLIGLVRLYQRFLSPLFPPSCRYQPTCSNYMIEALKKHGINGFFMGVSRILRCHPFVKGGYDPVPEVVCFKKKYTKGKNEDRDGEID